MRLRSAILMAAPVWLLITTPPAVAQAGRDAGAVVERSGFHIEEISTSIGYSSLPGLYTGNQGDSVYFGSAAADLALNAISRWATLRLSYVPSYFGTFQGSQRVQSFNQSGGIYLSSRTERKWTWNLSATGDDHTLVQFLVQPNIAGHTDAPGAATDPLPGTAPAETSALSMALYGSRLLTVSVGGGLGYKLRPRMRVAISGHAARFQSTGNQSDEKRTYLIPRTHTHEGNAAIYYLLTRRTELGGILNETRIQSAIGDYQQYSTVALLTRRISRHWFASAGGGAGVYYTLSGHNVPRGLSYIARGALGRSTRNSSFSASFERTLLDTYGLGATDTYTLTGAWSWHSPLSSWGLTVYSGTQRLAGGSVDGGQLWQAGGGVIRRMNRHMSAAIEYSHVTDSLARTAASSLLLSYGGIAANSARLTLRWNPSMVGVPALNGQGGGIGQ